MKKVFAPLTLAAFLLGATGVFAAAPKQTDKPAPAAATPAKKSSKKHASKHHTKAKDKAKTTGK